MAKYTIAQVEGRFIIERDGKAFKTPSGAAYALPTLALAKVVVSEWEAQDGKKINPRIMPFTQFAATAIDVVPKDRKNIVNRLAVYGGSELLCHRAEGPQELVEIQSRTWQPVLDWLEQRFSIKMLVGSGIMPLAQKDETLSVLREVVNACNDFRLTGLQAAVDGSGSLALGLAIIEGAMNAEAVFEAAEVDCSYQISRWGEDHETTTRRAGVMQDLKNAEKWFGLLI